ncbi:CAP domain-containing protein [Streptomyces vinaceus]|uniref:CAP domain-containing protein n=1 Tax=Streptomyces vinaceus TaxID=1960 RepID=UPI00367ADC6F
MGRHGAPGRTRRRGGRLGRTATLGIAALAVAGSVAAVSIGSQEPAAPANGHVARAPVQGPAGTDRPSGRAEPGTEPRLGAARLGLAQEPGEGRKADAPRQTGKPGTTGAERTEGTAGKDPSARHAASSAPAGSRQAVPRTAGAAAAAAEELVNVARAQAGCAPLTSSPALAALAARHSQDMAVDGYFSHAGPAGSSLWQRAARSGAPDVNAENIARGPADPQALLNAWMARPGSRANILNCGLRTVGTGAYFNGTGFWWTEDYGT